MRSSCVRAWVRREGGEGLGGREGVEDHTAERRLRDGVDELDSDVELCLDWGVGYGQACARGRGGV
jgi:hypothetical protein